MIQSSDSVQWSSPVIQSSNDPVHTVNRQNHVSVALYTGSPHWGASLETRLIQVYKSKLCEHYVSSLPVLCTRALHGLKDVDCMWDTISVTSGLLCSLLLQVFPIGVYNWTWELWRAPSADFSVLSFITPSSAFVTMTGEPSPTHQWVMRCLCFSSLHPGHELQTIKIVLWIRSRTRGQQNQLHIVYIYIYIYTEHTCTCAAI